MFIYLSPLSSNSFLPREKGEQNSFSHREKVDCDEVARQMRGTKENCEILFNMAKEKMKKDIRQN